MADSVPALSGISANTFIQALREQEAIRYARLFSNTLIIYDYICTLGFEVELIWRSRWSPIKVLFFVIRYYTLAASIFGTFGLFTLQLTDHLYAHALIPVFKGA
ncbi:hypothetical protein D9613_008235 [Agrocybe pediades]|uniref:DUF6533 domain-containing protein n=1 Tax=Agrocybe pediades TaxID=84607 RepID=A0A8H4VP49_9AGAR|nr:hypothetical protein D9613_008235 [Agrocybe pediades]